MQLKLAGWGLWLTRWVQATFLPAQTFTSATILACLCGVRIELSLYPFCHVIDTHVDTYVCLGGGMYILREFPGITLRLSCGRPHYGGSVVA